MPEERYVYIIELKYDGTARGALDQIERKGYALPFEAGTILEMKMRQVWKQKRVKFGSKNVPSLEMKTRQVWKQKRAKFRNENAPSLEIGG